MPASAGRVRMPHNNRMSTSASLKSNPIWQNTIGHDPYAGKDEGGGPSEAELKEGREKAAQVMAAARQQNLTDGASRDDFAQKMYMGLKGGKKRRADTAAVEVERSQFKEILEQESSSSEDEFIEEQRKKKSKKHKKKKSKSKRKKRKHHSSSEDSDSSDESSRQERRARKHSKKKRRKDRKRREYSSDSESSRPRKKSSRSEKKRSHKEEFIPSKTFSGSKTGYAFRSGEKGVGYYIDKAPRVDKKELKEALRMFKG